MFESLGFENLTAPQVVVWFGLGLGLLFGVLAQRSRFCLRRAIAGSETERAPAAGVWLTGLATALVGTQVAVALEWVDFSEHRFLTSELPLVAILAGGLMFGAGMVLARGCVSRLTVLTGQGNLRALTGILVFAIVAHATLKGVLAPIRTTLGSMTVPLGDVSSLSALPGGAGTWTAALALAALAFALRSGARLPGLLAGAAIGLLVPLGWLGTGFVLYDDFDPVALESLNFTLSTSETLFWSIASTAISPTFGTGLVGGVLLGSLVAALAGREFKWESFASPAQTGRSLVGAGLMGVGGVLAGGCSVGAGLAGVPTLGLAAIAALLSIVAGAWLTAQVLQPRSAAALHPAE